MLLAHRMRMHAVALLAPVMLCVEIAIANVIYASVLLHL
jgi:hypothetical protein